ncbi:hypothetical protein EHS25_008071 [Saitozyma podzolica]|uniref:CENP-V/GFA domain-containing protein n=1 Tax=Saitozyma podzolica TaxID=1890683 RepID=A0A427YNH7_9TREE|nr:hypothetical protein EHS25_008071 [Saitozyma podzolica]
MSSTRPGPKRVRSDQDHSHPAVQERESKRHEADEDDNGNGNGNGKGSAEAKASSKQSSREARPANHQDAEWLKEGPFQVGKSWDGWETKYRQSCWCNKTAFVYGGSPHNVKICHCEDCQRLHGAPHQHVAIFHKKDVRLDSSPEWLGFLSAHGEVHPLSSTPTPLPHKVTCRACGSPLMDEGRNMIMAFPPSFEFPRTQKDLEEMNAEIDKIHQNVDAANGKGNQDHAEAVEKHGKPGKWDKVSMPSELLPRHHIFYERRIIDVLDGLPKWRHLENTEEMGEKDR